MKHPARILSHARKLLFLCAVGFTAASAPQPRAATFAIGQRDFLLDGKPYQIRAGELHYARIPREYWAHRLRMAHALGLNTVSTYVFWNLHEEQPGEFTFAGNADIAQFCRTAQAEGLKVILRPGPYVCAEWDLGGLPSWLLKNPRVHLRTRDPQFLSPTRRYFKALGEQLAALQITKGGPIIMVQVENEYGAYGRDKGYMATLRDYLKEAGFEVPLCVCDMPSQINNAPVDDLLCLLNMHGDPEGNFNKLRSVHPSGPLMCGEWYSGWFDAWGHPSRGAAASPAIAKTPERILSSGASMNLYVAHGGTSFGFASGANGSVFAPTVTSYDYGAPISEAGWDTPKFYLLRELFLKHLGPNETIPDVPPRNPLINIPTIDFDEVAPVLSNLPKPKLSARPRCMESYDQPHGCILYRTRLPAGGGEQLLIQQLHDYGVVLLEGRKIGAIDRRLRQEPLVLPPRTNGLTLDLLVEAGGHINYGEPMQRDRKGITERVQLRQGPALTDLTGWEVFNLPLDAKELASLKFTRGATELPAFHRALFELKDTGDTFLDMSSWGKGMVWVNGHNLGRFWNIGPQQTLYCPGPWLKPGRNELIVLELAGARRYALAGVREPVLNSPR